MKQYGRFSKDKREYIINSPETPQPWFNYLFNDKYHALCSQSGGGFSYALDPKNNRILRYDHIQTDRPGRYVFIRDEKTGKAWSPNWQPYRKKLSSWKCHHGLGYSTIKAKNAGIEAEITYLVPKKDPAEIWSCRIKNTTKETKKLKLFPFVELISGDAELEVCYRNIVMLYNKGFYDKKLGAIVACKFPFARKHKETFNFFATSLPVSGFDCNKEIFLGKYNDIQSPEVITKGKCKNSFVRGEDMVGVFESKVTLKPGQEKEFTVVLGYTESKAQIKTFISKYNTPAKAKMELNILKKYWDNRINSISVKTPDADFDTMVNIWGKYQLEAITHWRGTSQFHGVEGGLGYRDTAQDAEGLFALNLELAKKKMDLLMVYQYQSGHAVSGFSEVEGTWDETGQSGVIGKADVCIWLPYAVVSYIKETGDVSYLKKKFRFNDTPKTATVYEHILRSVRHIFKTVGRHGLPLILKADWNDAYDHVGVDRKGQSVWLAMAMCRAAQQMAELADFIGDSKVAKEMRQKNKIMSERINKIGWDGNWYLAAFNDKGYKIGSGKNKEGKVPLNSQTWAMLSGIVPDSRKKSILKQIDRYLDTAYGPALFLPSYTNFNPGIGRVTSFAEGTKENAAVFSHACAFKIVADCHWKRGKEAYDTYRKLLPMNPAKADHEKYKVEPYVWAEYIIGPGSEHRFGQGAFTWNTGTAPWMFTAATEWMIGVRREFGGLLIDPCLPPKWKKCFIRRPFRGAIYEVSINNPKGKSSGVRQIKVDGKIHKGNLIKPFKDKKVHKIEVSM